MPDYKKILVSVSKSADDDLSYFSKQLHISKNELIRRSVENYISKLKSDKLNEKLRKGYIDMAEINLTLAEMYFESDESDFVCYEEKLSESENCEC